MSGLNPQHHSAVVARCDPQPRARDQYLQLDARGAAMWVEDPGAATVFDSMREATRAALHLSPGLRAYSLPRAADIPCLPTVH
jgi:hypothetical protein